MFLIDEMQFLAREELEAVAAAMHRMSQTKLPVALAGAGLPQLPGLMVEAKSYAERLFAYPKLGPLSEDAARQALVAPAEDKNVTFEDDALKRIVGESGGYPAFIQAYGKEAWNQAPGSPIRLCKRGGGPAPEGGFPLRWKACSTSAMLSGHSTFPRAPSRSLKRSVPPFRRAGGVRRRDPVVVFGAGGEPGADRPVDFHGYDP